MDFPHLTLIIFAIGALQNFDGITHDTENEREKDLGSASARHVNVHHDCSVVSKDFIILVNETK